MDDRPTYISLFAGIEGIGLGLERSGFRCLAQVEIDKFCRRVLDARFPDVPKFGDVREFGADSVRGRLLRPDGEGGGRRTADAGVETDERSSDDGHDRTIDLLCGGFPCQDVSVAGKRAGLAGARTGLFWEFIRVARELRPTWVLMENVPGLFSSNGGRDFGTVINAMGELGYGVAWRVLDSRYFGVAQRRRRVFIVGRLGEPCPPEILFEPESSGGNPAPRDEAGADIAGTLGGGAPGARGWRNDLDSHGAYIPTIGRALTKTMGKRHDDDTDTMIAHTLRASGFDASEDGTGRGTPMVVRMLGEHHAHIGGPAHDVRPETDLIIAAPLTSGGHPNSHAPGRRKEDDENLVAFRKSARVNADPESVETWVDDGLANTLNNFDVGDVRTTHAIVAQPLRSNPYNNSDPGMEARMHIYEGASVRRLTPTECERLQAFPDGWTCLCQPLDSYDSARCTCPDGPRYAALGNAVTVNPAAWIGQRIRAAMPEAGL